MLVEALMLWSNETLFVKLNVSDLIWGYEEPLFKKGSDIAAKFGINITDKFGLFVSQPQPITIQYCILMH